MNFYRQSYRFYRKMWNRRQSFVMALFDHPLMIRLFG